MVRGIRCGLRLVGRVERRGASSAGIVDTLGGNIRRRVGIRVAGIRRGLSPHSGERSFVGSTGRRLPRIEGVSLSCRSGRRWRFTPRRDGRLPAVIAVVVAVNRHSDGPDADEIPSAAALDSTGKLGCEVLYVRRGEFESTATVPKRLWISLPVLGVLIYRVLSLR